MPPMRTPTRRSAAARAPLTREGLPARCPRCFGSRASCGLATPSGRTHGVRLDHLTDGGRAHLEIDVRVRLDRHAPRRRDLQLLVDTLEALLGVRDRVDRPRRHLARRIDGNRYVKVARFRVNGDL